MISRYGRLVLVVVAVCCLFPASAQAALCDSDSWGGRAAGIDPSGTMAATISAQTNLHHFGSQQAHAFCHGDFFAKTTLVSGFGPSCESGGSSTHHTTLGEGTLAMSQRLCTGLLEDRYYYGGGIHWGFGESEEYTQSANSVMFPAPCLPNGERCNDDSDCCDNNCSITCNQPSPILVNLDNNRYILTGVTDGVRFDLNMNGSPEQLAWTEAYSSVGFLVLDRNDNGRIDNGSELFGNMTPKLDGTRARNGFEALLDLDGGPGTSDGQIDASDAIYGKLRVWVDRNHNGVSETDELMNLADAGLVAVMTAYRETPRVDGYGNRYWLEGNALVLRNGEPRSRTIFDVMFANQTDSCRRQ